MQQRFSTEDVSAAERIEFWRDAVCDSYVLLDCETATPGQFSGSIELTRREKLSTSYVTGSNQIVTRRRRDIARSEEETFLVSLQLTENGAVEQDGRLALLKQGDIVVYSSVRQYQLRLPNGFSQLVVQVPRNVLLSQLPNADRLTGVTLSSSTPCGALVAEMLVKLVNALSDMPAMAQIRAQHTIIDLLVTGLASLAPASYELNAPNQQTLLRTNSFIESKLSDPGLDRNMVAAWVGLSLRRLNEIYQKEGTSISRAIRESRLERIAQDLVDPRMQKHSISQIAFAWGMNNFQSFSRVFRKRYGQSPSDYRKNAGIGDLSGGSNRL